MRVAAGRLLSCASKAMKFAFNGVSWIGAAREVQRRWVVEDAQTAIAAGLYPRLMMTGLRSGSDYGIRCHALLSNATTVSRNADTFRSGKNTAKQVPLRPGCVLLCTRIEPPCLSTIPLATHRPRPVHSSTQPGRNGTCRSEEHTSELQSR